MAGRRAPVESVTEQGLTHVGEVEFCNAFRDLEPGESMVYYQGHLSHASLTRRNSEEARALVISIGQAAMQFEQEGRAELTQRRVGRQGSACWDYIIVKRRQVDEDGRCHWLEVFGTRVRHVERREVPVRKMSTHQVEMRQRFLQRHGHYAAGNIAVLDKKLDSRVVMRPSYLN